MANKVTLEQVKKVLGYKDNSKDEAIEALIPLVYQILENYVGWTELTVIKMIQYNIEHRPGISSESLSRHSINFFNDYPPTITRGVGRKL